jgi:hypothetical protein
MTTESWNFSGQHPLFAKTSMDHAYVAERGFFGGMVNQNTSIWRMDGAWYLVSAYMGFSGHKVVRLHAGRAARKFGQRKTGWPSKRTPNA